MYIQFQRTIWYTCNVNMQVYKHVHVHVFLHSCFSDSAVNEDLGWEMGGISEYHRGTVYIVHSYIQCCNSVCTCIHVVCACLKPLHRLLNGNGCVIHVHVYIYM